MKKRIGIAVVVVGVTVVAVAAYRAVQRKIDRLLLETGAWTKWQERRRARSSR